ncbi:unnamed protein product [Nesidiocoris tenuis]|uniref:Polycomb-like MTF2 factor 2 C-terminal domain-containing protein n=1 Tax=Nesidiocoris tenuis TaxID=355587 RepID=A0A6H5GHH5_9HEMI|nr:unnamed protein product [Nesidiocoris tenuis]
MYLKTPKSGLLLFGNSLVSSTVNFRAPKKRKTFLQRLHRLKATWKLRRPSKIQAATRVPLVAPRIQLFPPSWTTRIKRRRVMRRGAKLAGRTVQVLEKRLKRPRSGQVTPTASPMKNVASSSYSLEDLNSYFGASNRIASGEKFKIRARRTLPNARFIQGRLLSISPKTFFSLTLILKISCKKLK